MRCRVAVTTASGVLIRTSDRQAGHDHVGASVVALAVAAGGAAAALTHPCHARLPWQGTFHARDTENLALPQGGHGFCHRCDTR